MKKLIATILAAVLAVGGLASCSSSGNKLEEIQEAGPGDLHLVKIGARQVHLLHQNQLL